MFKLLLFVVILGLSVGMSSASANLQPRPAFAAPEQGAAIDDVIDRAHQLVGTRYKLGGTSVQQGFDCSSFLVYLFKTQANIQLPRTTTAMHRSTATTIQRSALKPGDAVFFKGNGRGPVSHVGLYIGEGKFIHSPRTGKTVRIDSLSNRYWNKYYTSAKRFHQAG
ncbi:putative endopeptidase YafL precursor [Pseudomonas sp. 22 E 5]|jgi:murein DD-endopeptidase|uniref:C40 family peptidase n=1 Tax=Pseudomonas TaxID=286 RepID=UPI00030B2419|nr:MULTISPECIES: C40 family peptidase [Pseudomonas]TKJ61752.1 peptidoglycan endopeptidase [Pseudomonas sp. CFBP13506]CRM46372.1 putative endopeptidase YafL precursor [Pseudomonas sp. 31 E 6]CRM66783.1 putative endopeptidase YafL precursor [Pseudomonas sp. 31 E 5]CRM93360.1 putative endopeptidase YafL precursor [Pseudomonas sp. 22 E 5]